VVVANGPVILPLEQARAETCGAKAAAAQRLLELATRSHGLFRAPRGLAVPFGAMERCLDSAAAKPEYDSLRKQLKGDRESHLVRMRELLRSLPVPEEIGKEATRFFGPETRLAVRSSSNGEDLEQLAGAGLYESVVNVAAGAVGSAIAQVWASLWTRRSTLSRLQAGIPYDRIRMAVLLQELVVPELSFIMHTANPQTNSRDEAVVELAVGLGEVLASSSLPGTPCRLVCDRRSDRVQVQTCASFSFALRPSPGAERIVRERLDYSGVAMSADESVAQRLGKRLAQIATFLEGELGCPQDVEGVCIGEDIYLVQTRPQQGL
jgi:phosphoglucan,water dikinase